jgi:hypothetical protein
MAILARYRSPARPLHANTLGSIPKKGISPASLSHSSELSNTLRLTQLAAIFNSKVMFDHPHPGHRAPDLARIQLVCVSYVYIPCSGPHEVYEVYDHTACDLPE